MDDTLSNAWCRLWNPGGSLMRKEIEMVRSSRRSVLVMVVTFLVILTIMVGTSLGWATLGDHTPYNGPSFPAPTPTGQGFRGLG